MKLDVLASTVDIAASHSLARPTAEMLEERSDMERPEHHNTDRLREREGRERQRSTFHPQWSGTSCI